MRLDPLGGTVELGRAELHALARAPGGARRDIETALATHLYRVATWGRGPAAKLQRLASVRSGAGLSNPHCRGEYVAIGWFDKKDLPEPSHPLMRLAPESAIEAFAP